MRLILYLASFYFAFVSFKNLQNIFLQNQSQSWISTSSQVTDNPYFSNVMILKDFHFFAVDPLFLPDNWRAVLRDCSAPLQVTVNGRTQMPAVCYFTYMSHALSDISKNQSVLLYQENGNSGGQSLFAGISWNQLILGDWIFLLCQLIGLSFPLLIFYGNNFSELFDKLISAVW